MAAATPKRKTVSIKEPARTCTRPVRTDSKMKFTSMYGENVHPRGVCPSSEPFLTFDMPYQVFCCSAKKPSAREHDTYLQYLLENLSEHNPTIEEMTAWTQWKTGPQSQQLKELVLHEKDPVLKASLMRAYRKGNVVPYREKDFTKGATRNTINYVQAMRTYLVNKIKQQQEESDRETLRLLAAFQRQQKQERQRRQKQQPQERQGREKKMLKK